MGPKAPHSTTMESGNLRQPDGVEGEMRRQQRLLGTNFPEFCQQKSRMASRIVTSIVLLVLFLK